MKFQWYIISLESCEVQGTNDVENLEEFIENDDYVILSAQHGTYFCGDRESIEVEELASEEGDDDDIPF